MHISACRITFQMLLIRLDCETLEFFLIVGNIVQCLQTLPPSTSDESAGPGGSRRRGMTWLLAWSKGLRVRIPPRAWMLVFVFVCVI